MVHIDSDDYCSRSSDHQPLLRYTVPTGYLTTDPTTVLAKDGELVKRLVIVR